MRRSPTQLRWERLTIAVMALTLVGCGSTQPEARIAQPLQADPDALNRLSNPGKPYAATLPRDELVLRRLAESGREIRRILKMSQRGGRAFYRVDAQCFATGPATPTTQSFGAIVCAPQFPSPTQPVLDFTVFHSASASDGSPPSKLTVYQSEGFAADGVDRVAFVDAADAVVADTAVIDNTYSFDPAPSGANLRIAAFSMSGERIYEQPKRDAPASTP